ILKSSRIFDLDKKNPHVYTANIQNLFAINSDIIKAIFNNEPFPDLRDPGITNIYELLNKLHDLGEKRNRRELSTYDLFMQAKNLLEENAHFPLIYKINL